MATLLDPHFYLMHPEHGLYSGMVQDWTSFRESHTVRKWPTLENARNYCLSTLVRYGVVWLENLMRMRIVRFDNNGTARWAIPVFDVKDIPVIRTHYFRSRWPAESNDTVGLEDIFQQNDEQFDGELKQLDHYVEMDPENYLDLCQRVTLWDARTRGYRDKLLARGLEAEYRAARPIYVMENVFFFANEEDTMMFKLVLEGNNRNGSLKRNLKEFHEWVARIWGEESASKSGW